MAEPRRVPACFGDGGLTTACPTVFSMDDPELASVARALSHPARVATIRQFGDGEPKTTQELVAPSGLAPSTMSEHLRILREAGVIVSRQDGPRVWYCLCGDRLAEFAGVAQELSHISRREAVDSGPRTLPMFVE